MKRFLFALGLVWFGLLSAPAFAQTTWNPADKAANITLSGGNLTANASVGGTGYGFVRATSSHSSGKWYFELNITADSVSSSIILGIVNAASSTVAVPGVLDANGSMYVSYTGTVGAIYANSAGTVLSATPYTTGATIGVAVDVTNHLVYFARNNVWQNAANPSAGTGGINYITTSPVFPFFGAQTNEYTTAVANFGASAYAYTIPSGFSSWDAQAGAGGSNLSLLGVGH